MPVSSQSDNIRLHGEARRVRLTTRAGNQEPYFSSGGFTEVICRGEVCGEVMSGKDANVCLELWDAAPGVTDRHLLRG